MKRRRYRERWRKGKGENGGKEEWLANEIKEEYETKWKRK